jgi:hypothetical protein
MDPTEDLEVLESLFSSGKGLENGQLLLFEGQPWMHPAGLAELEGQVGYKLPTEIATFLQCFGGTRLFVDSYGCGVQILPIAEIATRNFALQEAEDPFWPTFVIIGFDSVDNMLCLYNDGDRVHFGNLDHEAWGCSDQWVSEAMTFAPFARWLRMFIESKGETLPDKGMSYEI